MTATATTNPNFSFVLEHPAAEPAAAERHFLARLAFETDPADVHLDLGRGHPGIVLVDSRSPEAYARCHIPGAINLPTRTINRDTTASLPHDKVIVTYCWGPGCNGSTRAAGRRVVPGRRSAVRLRTLRSTPGTPRASARRNRRRSRTGFAAFSIKWRDPSSTLRGRGPACASTSTAHCDAGRGTGPSGSRETTSHST
jgi:hypothetical protein